MHEDSITTWFASQSNADSRQFPIGIGDDMAQVRAGADGTLLVTTDMLLDGAHFDLSVCTLEEACYKAMAASLSDCAAMATVPVCAVVAVALPTDFGADELKRIHAGVVEAGRQFGCELIGGDITKWKDDTESFAINVTMLSKPSGYHPPVRRSGAQVGDIICVTGPLGGSLAGKHLHFTPRVNEALALTKAATINAMMDITDGLVTDLNRICTQSGVGALLEAEKLPVSAAAEKTDDPLYATFYDGEDFELLFTLSPAEFDKIKNLDNVTVLTVGKVTDTGKIQNLLTDGRTVDVRPGGYDHLA
ncbi:MAG: thiamine-phosphate kinase [Planctomycetota bacterium]